MRTIISPSKRWTGHVILHDPLNLVQVYAIEDVSDKAIEIEPSKYLQLIQDKTGKDINVRWSSRSDALLIPAILLCVAEWHLSGFPEDLKADTFPVTPRKDSRQLIDWLWDEINKVYLGDNEVPNAS